MQQIEDGQEQSAKENTVFKVVTRGWIKLHIEGPHNLYSSPNIISTIKWSSRVGYVAHMGKIRNIYKS
jgi:hypothetical protein